MITNTLENKTYEEIRIGDQVQLQRTLSDKDIDLFAAVSGNVNPIHMEDDYSEDDIEGRVGHSLWSGSLISALIGNELPGPGTICRHQDLHYHRQIIVGDSVTATIVVKDKVDQGHIVVFECRCVNQHNKLIANGVTEVIAPVKKIVRPRPELPSVLVQTSDSYAELVSRCESLEPVSTVVAHPCDKISLTGVIEAARAQLITPILVGSKHKIMELAKSAELDISGFPIHDVPHSHAAASTAVELVRQGSAEILMKGSLHTDELLSAILSSSTGIKTERRISHVFVMDVPTYPKLLLVTDGAVNLFPDLIAKRDICQNAIDLAQTLNIGTPKVAILSAVEKVNPKIPSTVEAGALCKMADRGQIKGAILDGPLAFDNAISKQAAITKKIVSEVAGNADILVAPDLEAGNILAKQLSFLNHADAAGILLGAKVPVILTSRADNLRARMASCCVAVLQAHAHRGLVPGK